MCRETAAARPGWLLPVSPEGVNVTAVIGLNPVALACSALLLGVAVMLTIRTRKMAWAPAFIALAQISTYEFLHVKWQEFIYIDDNKNIPTLLHVASGLYFIGLGAGVLGLAYMAVRYVIVSMLK